jgi:hypothetical protein
VESLVRYARADKGLLGLLLLPSIAIGEDDILGSPMGLSEIRASPALSGSRSRVKEDPGCVRRA